MKTVTEWQPIFYFYLVYLLSILIRQYFITEQRYVHLTVRTLSVHLTYTHHNIAFPVQI